MNIDRYLKREFDFSELDMDWLKEIDVTTECIVEAVENERSSLEDMPDWNPSDCRWFCVGFATNMRPLFILLRYSEPKIFIQDVTIANEYDIKQFWCEKRRRPRI